MRLELGLIHGIVQELDLFVNGRPIRFYAERLCPVEGKGPADVDLVVIRETTAELNAVTARHDLPRYFGLLDGTVRPPRSAYLLRWT